MPSARRYVLTGDDLYLHAMEGAWGMFRDYWIHVGGSIAINEQRPYPPGSYFLDGSPTGELCGSSFWIRFNQRFHRLRPKEEVYTLEIERSLFNVVLANQGPRNPRGQPGGGIRYFARMLGKKASPGNIATCCESQATRTYGALPEFVYSVGQRGEVYVNLFVPSRMETREGAVITQNTTFPVGGDVRITVADAAVTLVLRIPAWARSAARVSVRISEGGTAQELVGHPGSYLELPQIQSGGSVVCTFEMGLRVSVYNGTTADPAHAPGCTPPPGGRDNRTRAAIEYGPILLAVVPSAYAAANLSQCSSGASDVSDLSLQGAFTLMGIDLLGEDPDTWLTRSPAPLPPHRLSFAVRGNPCATFVPYFSVQFEEMAVYPAFQKTQPPPPTPVLCSVVTENFPAKTAAVCLSCATGQAVNGVAMADFGSIAGTCEAGFRLNHSCLADPAKVKRYVAAQCLGASECSVVADAVRANVTDPCVGVYKQLAVRVSCAAKQCDIVRENFPAETASVSVGCSNGERITRVVDAEFGEIEGQCPRFLVRGCHADPVAVRKVVEARCLGKQGCKVPANVAFFGKDPCVGVPKQLAVRVQCGNGALDRWSALPHWWK